MLPPTGGASGTESFLGCGTGSGNVVPSQEAVSSQSNPLYTGFIFDTRGLPTLRVPTNKREKAWAMVEYIKGRGLVNKVSRLSLAVLTGVLESLAEATPARVGHTYLRRLYDLIHDPVEDNKDIYATYAHLTSAILGDLAWWIQLLKRDMSRPARSQRSATLVPTFGDGSGTGTGGTINLPGLGLTMWMGQWTPFVFPKSSNWKELKTLLLTLQELAANHSQSVQGTTLFYFTDNSASYFICAGGSSRSPGLQRLVEQIKLLEISLQVQLQVVHVPGTAMIAQGTDGLSRGVWLSTLHPLLDQGVLTESIFRPVPYQGNWVAQFASELNWAPDEMQISDWQNPRRDAQLMHCLTAHFPPPELARQSIVFFLEAWVESPTDTGALFFVPRVVPAFWHGLSRHVEELALIPASHTTPPPLLPIPTIVLCVKPHTRVLRELPTGMDYHRNPRRRRGDHDIAADLLRTLSPRSLRPTY